MTITRSHSRDQYDRMTHCPADRNTDARANAYSRETVVTRLLDSVIEAHGGANRWKEFSDLVTDIDLSGELFQQAGWSPISPQSRLLIALRSQRTILLLPEERGRLILEPGRLSHFDGARKEVESMSDPAARLSRLHPGFKWDMLSATYFLINMVRRSIAAPFLYVSPGFSTEEIAPWSEDGEVWQVLKVTFPSGDELPSTVQYAYYGPDGLLRRLRHSVTLLGGLELVEYVTSYGDVNGIRIPLVRDIFACDSAGCKLRQQYLGHLELRDTFLTT
jgi:hypothetical protein